MLAPVLDPHGRPYDVIELTGLVVDCVVGIYPAERTRPQPLALDVALFFDARGVGSSGKLEQSINYARLVAELRFLLESCHFELLESAAEALCRYVLAPPTADAPRAQVEAVTVSLGKPSAHSRVQLHRRASEAKPVVETKGFGQVDIIHETAGYGIYRLRVRPGGAIPTHVHRVMEERELVLGDGLLLQKQPVRRGTAHSWPHQLPHRYDNPTSSEQTVLCVDRPPFIPSDEIEVATEQLTPVIGTAYYPEEERQ